MAAAVAAQFTNAELEDYGNITLNGYLSVIPNTINKKAWQYSKTTTPPVNLPSLSTVRPVLKGWTTNYGEYFTQLPPNAYNQVPGNPTNFFYNVHSSIPPVPPRTNFITTLGSLNPGVGYVPGTYPRCLFEGGTGRGAWGSITVSPGVGGVITSLGEIIEGSGYTPGVYPNVALTGGGGLGAKGTVTVSTSQPKGIKKIGNFVTTTYPLGQQGIYSNRSVVGGSGTGAKVTFEIKLGIANNFNLLSAGIYPPNSTFNNVETRAVTGTGRNIRLNITTNALGQISGASLVSAGAGYILNDIISIGPNFTGNAVVTGVDFTLGGLYSLTLTDMGTNYNTGDICTVSAPPFGGSFTFGVLSTFPPTPINYVSDVVLTDGGVGYSSGNTLTGTLPGGGSGWSVPVETATPIVTAPGTVSNVTLIGGGEGYTIGDTLTFPLPDGAGWNIQVTGVGSSPFIPNGDPRWAACPRRTYANGYSFMHPALTGDNTTPPPIDIL